MDSIFYNLINPMWIIHIVQNVILFLDQTCKLSFIAVPNISWINNGQKTCFSIWIPLNIGLSRDMFAFDNNSSQFILIKNTPGLFFNSELRKASNHLTVCVRIVVKCMINSESKLLVDRIKVD